MKIGRSIVLSHSRRVPIPEKPAPVPVLPKRKALLIGIIYAESETYAPLKGPHADVRRMQKLLVDQYGYAPEDIVMLLDDSGEGGGVQPTRVNILRAIGDLVRGARKGDRFFFHYCGHTTQTENRSNSEEDGMDECLVPADGEDNKILDNELRRHLVDALPVGSSLVAVFDSCHSASLLDLAHFRCNRVYVPWISKGRRRSDDRWNANVRRHALPFLPLSPEAQAEAQSVDVTRTNTLTTATNTHTTTAISQKATTVVPAAPSTSQLKPKSKATKRATKRATREMRQLAQLLQGPVHVPLPPVPSSTPSSASPSRSPSSHLPPSRTDAAPALPEEDVDAPTRLGSPAEDVATPMVSTRRIYEAMRTSAKTVKAYRTEIDTLDLGMGGTAESESGDGEVARGENMKAKQEKKKKGEKGLGRAATENAVAAEDPTTAAAGGKGKEKTEGKQPQRSKRSSLALLSSISLRSGSGSGSFPFSSARADSGSGAKENRQASAEAEGQGGVEQQQQQRRTSVVRGRAVSVLLGKENAPPLSAPSLPAPFAAPAHTSAAPAAAPLPAPPMPTARALETRALALRVDTTPRRPVSWLEEGPSAVDRACESPEPVWRCQGTRCRDPDHKHDEEDMEEKADVISLASCKDSQLSWEDADGGSMTRELVRILERDPHPTFRALLTSVSHALHRMSIERHLETRRYKRETKRYEAYLERLRKAGRYPPLPQPQPPATDDDGDSALTVADPPPQVTAKAKSGSFLDTIEAPVYDMDNFQDPQLSSHKPLDMEKPFTI